MAIRSANPGTDIYLPNLSTNMIVAASVLDPAGVSDADDVGRTQDGAAKPWTRGKRQDRGGRWQQAGVRLAKGATGIERATRTLATMFLDTAAGEGSVTGFQVLVAGLAPRRSWNPG
jgi:hypothetical protein